jgi:hypothetical protein
MPSSCNGVRLCPSASQPIVAATSGTTRVRKLIADAGSAPTPRIHRKYETAPPMTAR